MPEDGISKKWMFEGKVYMRTWMDSMYECVETDDGVGTEGAYLGGFRNDKIDASVANVHQDDEEEEEAEAEADAEVVVEDE